MGCVVRDKFISTAHWADAGKSARFTIHKNRESAPLLDDSGRGYGDRRFLSTLKQSGQHERGSVSLSYAKTIFLPILPPQCSHYLSFGPTRSVQCRRQLRRRLATSPFLRSTKRLPFVTHRGGVIHIAGKADRPQEIPTVSPA